MYCSLDKDGNLTIFIEAKESEVQLELMESLIPDSEKDNLKCQQIIEMISHRHRLQNQEQYLVETPKSLIN